MIPYISWWRRIIAWLLWRFEGYESIDGARFCIIEHPELTRTACLMRDYWYAKNAEGHE
ncbi:MAG: hypothetical protein IKE22_07075 [Atopobiaceae bacterium]|nr:hypothetical protein [Atopobiaceae bacterium]